MRTNSYILLIPFFLWFSCQNRNTGYTPEQKIKIDNFKHANNTLLEDRHPDSMLILSRQVLEICDPQKEPSLYFDALTSAGLAFDHMAEFDSTEYYYNKAILLAENSNNPKKFAFGLQLKANHYINRKNLLMAKKKFKEALMVNKQINNQEQVAANYSGLGLVNSKMNKIDTAIDCYLKASEIFKAHGNAYNQAIVYGNIAAVYVEESMHENSIHYLQLAIAINDSLENMYRLGQNYNTLGTVYTNAEKFDTAFFYLKKAISIAEQTSDEIGGLQATLNLGKAKTLSGNYRHGKQLLLEVFRFCEQNNIEEGQIRSLLELGENERLQGRLLVAERYFTDALSITNSSEYQKLRLAALFGLSKLAIDKTSLNHQNYLVAYQELKDSISDYNLKENIQELESFYHHKENKARIANLEKENQYEKKQLQLWIIISLLVLGSSILFFIFLRNKQKQLQIQKQLAEEKTKVTKALLTKKETEVVLKSEEAHSFDLARRMKEQEIIHQAQAYGKLINTIHEVRAGLDDFKFKFRTKKDTDAFNNILQQIDKANGLNPLSNLLHAFKDLHPEFCAKLSGKHPELSPRELEMCALISLNMSSKQISGLLNITTKSVEIARHRVRKKLSLQPDQNLTTEIMQHIDRN